jgi:purine-binding chemotaxis protein CheW
VSSRNADCDGAGIGGDWKVGGCVAVATDSSQLVMFVVEGQRYALPLEIVDRVVRAVAVTALPEAPPIIVGVIGLQGRVVPVVDLRKRFRLERREIDIEDHFVIARSSTGAVALPVDEAEGLIKDLGGEKVPAAEIVPNLNYVREVFLLGPEMVFVLDIDTVLTDDEELVLADSLRDIEAVRA